MLELVFEKEDGEVSVRVDVLPYIIDTCRGFGIQDGHLYIIHNEIEEDEFFPVTVSYDCGDGYGDFANYTPKYFHEVREE